MNAYIQGLLGIGTANAPTVQPVQQSRFEGAPASEPVEIFEETLAQPPANQHTPAAEPATGTEPATDSRPDGEAVAAPDRVPGQLRIDSAVTDSERGEPGGESTDKPRHSVAVAPAPEGREDIGTERPSRRVDVQPGTVVVAASPAPDATIPEIAYPETRTEDQPVQDAPPATAVEGTQDISITIGRVIVTAPRESAPARKPKRRPVGVTTLDEYLGHRRKDERR